jgi:uncharacterized membrane protein
MTLLVGGLALFIVSHLLPAVPGLRDALATRLGAGVYRISFSLVSTVALLMIVFGYARADRGGQLFAPVPGATAIAPYAMTLVFILFASSHAPSHIRAAVKHPLLIGTLIWSALHLLANGDLRGTVLFGGFLAYALVDLASALRRGPVANLAPRARADVIAIVAGVAISLLVMAFHRVLFGPQVVPFGV